MRRTLIIVLSLIAAPALASPLLERCVADEGEPRRAYCACSVNYLQANIDANLYAFLEDYSAFPDPDAVSHPEMFALVAKHQLTETQVIDMQRAFNQIDSQAEALCN